MIAALVWFLIGFAFGALTLAALLPVWELPAAAEVGKKL